MVEMLAMMTITSRLSAIGMLTGFLMILSRSFSCSAMDTITFNSPLKENEETLVSSGGRFELAFFKPNGSNINNRYAGIRYKSNPEIIVWVANRDRPLSGSSHGVFAIAENGKLQVLDGISKTSIYWSTNSTPMSSSKSARVRLLDNGNLVLENEDATLIWQRIWQSFDNPTDTFLPGMKMHKGFKLRSWRSQGDPAQQDSLDSNLAGAKRFLQSV